MSTANLGRLGLIEQPMPVKPLQLSPWQRKVAGLVQSVDSLNSLVLAGVRRRKVDPPGLFDRVLRPDQRRRLQRRADPSRSGRPLQARGSAAGPAADADAR